MTTDLSALARPADTDNDGRQPLNPNGRPQAEEADASSVLSFALHSAAALAALGFFLGAVAALAMITEGGW